MVLRMSFCDRLSSIVRACVRQQLLKQHLPFNHLSNFNETLQECSLHDALPKLFKELWIGLKLLFTQILEIMTSLLLIKIWKIGNCRNVKMKKLIISMDTFQVSSRKKWEVKTSHLTKVINEQMQQCQASKTIWTIFSW